MLRPLEAALLGPSSTHALFQPFSFLVCFSSTCMEAPGTQTTDLTLLLPHLEIRGPRSSDLGCLPLLALLLASLWLTWSQRAICLVFHLETPVVRSRFMLPRNTTRFTLWFLQFASWWGQKL